MTLHEAIELFKDHQKDNAKEKTRESYGYLFRNLETLLEDGPLDAIRAQDLYQFLLLVTEGRARSTARLRYAQLKSFFLCAELHKKNNADTVVMRRKGSETQA